MLVTGKQIQAARVLLGMTREELWEKAEVPMRTLQNVENESGNPTMATMTKIVDALRKAGIDFIDDDYAAGKGVGVRLSKAKRR
jgi:DNA-binding XRE family transcriptional regulator